MKSNKTRSLDNKSLFKKIAILEKKFKDLEESIEDGSLLSDLETNLMVEKAVINKNKKNIIRDR